MTASFSSRYRDGEYEAVWQELISLGERVYSEPLYTDAWNVAQETMKRVRHNIEIVVDRLPKLGYTFGAGFLDEYTDEEKEQVKHDAPVYQPPTPDTPHRIQQFEQQAGALPLSLRAFYEVVGSVNLVGKFPPGVLDVAEPKERHTLYRQPEWRTYLSHGLDPLFVYSLDMARTMFLSWKASKEKKQNGALLPYLLPIAPDHHFKYSESGGGEYSVEIPCLAADSPLHLEWHHTSFVNYLRICLRWGGLPGLEHAPQSLQPQVTEIINILTDGLLCF